MTRSGFVALAGRPNVGKSTLVNAIVATKVAITSDKPQTTRRAIRGVATAPDGSWQLVLVDLPGVQRPRDLLTERMQHSVERELGDADAVLFVLDATTKSGPGDRFIATALAGSPVPVVAAVNKVDRLKWPQVAAALAQAESLEQTGVELREIFPVSARDGAGVPELVEALVGLLPEGPLYFPPEESSDQPESVRVAELVREQVLLRTRDEVPHAVEVEVEEVERKDDLIVVRASVWVETESQKGILVGRGGRMVKAIGTAARREVEATLGAHVHLELRVRVRRGWRKDEGLLDRIGIAD